jgi:LytS/YehU family sensor histidine kinase
MSLVEKKLPINTDKLYRITLRHHIIFWGIYFIITTIRWGGIHNDYLYSLKTTLIGFPIHMTLCYFTIYFLMPRFVYKRRYIQFIVMLFAALFFMLLVKFNLTYYLVSTNVWPEGPEVVNKLTLNYSIDMMIGELYVITFVTAIKVTLDWLYEHKRVTDLEKMQMQTELLFLRTQISPHFFFNTLNNIYSLAIEKSEKTAKLILKLSELMRYLLYETKENRQDLEKEILCIHNYLELERIRYGELLEVEIDITGDISEKKIAPIILLSFVENAIKHGAGKNIDRIYMKIAFEIKGDFLHFSISNPKPALAEAEQLGKASGIGLTNVRKRLSLGYKDNEYELEIKELEKTFEVNLKIKVS